MLPVIRSTVRYHLIQRFALDLLHLLQVQLNNSYQQATDASLLVNTPLPEDLSKVQAGKMGFFITSQHIYNPNPNTTYTIVSPTFTMRSVINIHSGRAVESFTQADVNRLRLAYVVASHPLEAYFSRLSVAEDRLELLVISPSRRSDSAFIKKS